MSKLEENFKELIDKEENFLSIENALNVEKVAKDCAVLTEQECIAFKKFCDKSLLIRTDEEMYELYQKSKEPINGYWNKNGEYVVTKNK